MSKRSIILVGNPDSGKTNYLACLWMALRARTCALVAPNLPTGLKYVEEALAHIHRGKFAPRSDKNFEGFRYNLTVPVVEAAHPDVEPTEIVVPDVVGELWKSAVETYEIPLEWMEQLRSAMGALLFVRIHSEENVDPLDWVTAAGLLRMGLEEKDREEDEDDEEEEEELDRAGVEQALPPPAEAMPAVNVEEANETVEEASGEANTENDQRPPVPTQVSLCELLRFLSDELSSPGDGVKPRIAVLVTAWDRLDDETAKRGPMAYLQSQYPLFAGRLADISEVECNVFGVSSVGGDFLDPAYVKKFREADLKAPGYIVEDVDGGVETRLDITLPVAWVIQGHAT